MKLAILVLVAALAALAIAAASEQLFSEIVAVKSGVDFLPRRLGEAFDRLTIRADGSPDDTPPPDPPEYLGNGWDINVIAAPQEAEAKRAKGAWVNCLLKATDEEAGKAWPDPYHRTPKSARSLWGPTDKDLKDWFWHEASYNQDNNCDFTDDTLEVAEHAQQPLNMLGLSHLPKDKGGDNVCFSIEHSDELALDKEGDPIEYDQQHYQVNGESFMATGAWHRFGINHVGGAILAISHEAPSFAAAEFWPQEPTPQDLPHLNKGSDIMFHYWARANPHPQNLRYYFVLNVLNPETNALISRIIHDDPALDDLPVYPGKTMLAGSPGFDMLLGSPVGLTLAYLLLQHKAELGTKHVADVAFFQEPRVAHDADVNKEVLMVFTIADVERVEDPQSEDKDTEMKDGEVEGGSLKMGRGVTRMHEFRIREGSVTRASVGAF